MRVREQELGNKNLIGKNVEKERKKQGLKQKELLAKLQVAGIDIGASGLSKLEGQLRMVSDKELVTLAKILNVSIGALLNTSS